MQKRQKNLFQYLFVFNLLLGLAAIFLLLQTRKENVNALFGYSSGRLIIIITEVLGFILFVSIFAWLLKDENAGTRFSNWAANLPSLNNIGLVLFIFLSISCIGFVWIALSGRWNQLGNFGTLIQRMVPFLVWPASIVPQLFFYQSLTRKTGWGKNTILSLLITNGCIVFMILDTLLRTKGFQSKQLQALALYKILPDFAWVFILLAILFIGDKLFSKILTTRKDEYIFLRNGLFVFLFATLLYVLSAIVLGQYGTGDQAYSPALAKALLQGHAYLENPASKVDLTYANGHWYVPYPPLVAILMIPQVAMSGVENINTIQFSIFFAALNAALVFMILEKLRQRGWSSATRLSNIWLTVMFGFGTIHWYLTLWGEVWPLNQLTATTFVALSVLIALAEGPAWLAGLSLGIAALARPHLTLTYPILLGIYWNSLNPWNLTNQWKNLFKWMVLSGLGLSVSVIGILLYNNLRFGSPLDFGYAASQINIGLFSEDLQRYGQFNPHFILRNLQVIFLGLPYWNSQCNFFSANEVGMSILITTPALIYVLRAQKMNPLTISAWITLGLFLTVLLLHYSTGAIQFGYRFLLDFLLPVMVLLGISLPAEKLAFHQKTLILFGILVNYWGLWWFFRHWCR